MPKFVHDNDLDKRTGLYKRATPHKTVTVGSHRATMNPNFKRPPTKATKTGAKVADVCRRGHPFTAENTITKTDGHRKCRTCFNAAAQARKAK